MVLLLIMLELASPLAFAKVAAIGAHRHLHAVTSGIPCNTSSIRSAALDIITSDEYTQNTMRLYHVQLTMLATGGPSCDMIGKASPHDTPAPPTI